MTIIPETEITLDLNSSDIIEEDLDLIIDMKNLKSQGFCDFCALEMCLCDLTKLDMTNAQFKDEEAKRIKADEVLEVIEVFDDSTPLQQADSHKEGNLEILGDLKPTKPGIDVDEEGGTEIVVEEDDNEDSGVLPPP